MDRVRAATLYSVARWLRGEGIGARGGVDGSRRKIGREDGGSGTRR